MRIVKLFAPFLCNVQKESGWVTSRPADALCENASFTKGWMPEEILRTVNDRTRAGASFGTTLRAAVLN